MKTTRLFRSIAAAGVAAMLCVALAGCGDNGDQAAKDFALQLAKTIQTGDSTRLVALYPAASSIDSLVVPDTTQLNVTRTDSGVNVSFGSSAVLELTQDKEGNYSVRSSRGLLAIPAAYKAYADRTGWVDSTLTDVQNAARLKDEAFPAEMLTLMQKSLDSKLTVKGGKKEDYTLLGFNFPVSITVTNNTDEQISGSTYSIRTSMYIVGRFMMEGQSYPDDETQVRILPGKDIAPHGSVTLTTSVEPNVMYGHGLEITTQGTVVWNVPAETQQQMLATYPFTGKEYAAYLAKKK